jgi:hypothetical protein
MPTFRIVYIDDDTFAPRTLTAAFADRAAAEIEMAKHGHRVVHLAEMRVGETAADPVSVPMAAASDARLTAPRPNTQEHITATQPLLGLPRYDLAGVAVVAAGIAVAGAAYLLF